ncbi:voltage-gated potassium channel subunit beta [Phytophthora cinnamomi]|uniref:voltage-gated potassium channel subunit beta n=1 Tax=Phytophthora cinnamomi TaxID=4785 RepID=UPI003559D7A9|nr:voltage-gated potassium channel subunit beta [Phytophthora cinnamomi]
MALRRFEIERAGRLAGAGPICQQQQQPRSWRAMSGGKGGSSNTCSSRRALSPRPAPRADDSDAVVVVAQEALAAAALGWQQRAERLERDNARLRERVAEVEETHRRSRTAVKNVPTLPNNHVFTKQLVDENHTLRRETRELQRRLMQFEGPGSKRTRMLASETQQRRQPREKKAAEAAPAAKPNQTTTHDRTEVEKDETVAASQSPAENLPRNNSVVDLARHPLVQTLKSHLRGLEVDLERLQKENELLRTELEECRTTDKPPQLVKDAPEEDNSNNAREADQASLRMFVDALQQQVKVLEARYQHLEEKTRAKAVLYRESTSRLEEMSTQLFETQQQLAAQAEKLHVYTDQSAQMEDLQQEIRLLRSENVRLDETIAALSSRPFDALSKDLQKKNLWVAQIEEEKRGLEEDCAKLQQDCIATRRMNDMLRRRVEAMTNEVKSLADQLNRVKADCEQKTMDVEVAQLQLRFYTAPGDYALMSAVGKALKETKKQRNDLEMHVVDNDVPAPNSNSGSI